ncbi:hydroxysqualene dehydroxylase HpnE [Methyloceanibacter sp.]|uniref:hydroxysqualene dehydroxylase HpnE n=1 Tax=Methyloceanibacter sp. TaxID=1965321 RepID=UPI002D6C16C1|nr:hydroxysqualene dehydroxylase HpnE [Methyloceanibacter sp.]HZP07782.1 hydroxysqualene dehydroxylase HpnE [Methyloceanibacter sp.]
MASGTVHIIGAGLAGLSAAVSLVDSGGDVVVHELARHAGGRCRSYFEPALGLNIDNGNHLLLSANDAALSFLETIGSKGKLAGPNEAKFAFADLTSGESWTLHPNEGPIPWWIFVKDRRVPGTRPLDYLSMLRLLKPGADESLDKIIDCSGILYERLSRPLFLAALNTEPREASALLASAILRKTLARGGRACHPLIASEGLGSAFIDPALSYLDRNGAKVCFMHQLRRIEIAGDRAQSLDFSDDSIELAPGDDVVLAVPAAVARLLVPGLQGPGRFRAIVNAHFKVAPPDGFPRLLGIVNGTAEWLFAYPDRISATISAADRFIETAREELAEAIWSDIAKLIGAERAMPPWHIVKERRATFAALPEENAKRPGPKTRLSNLYLAGDWTATGLPATIEGAICSGKTAASLVLAKSRQGLNGKGRRRTP